MNTYYAPTLFLLSLFLLIGCTSPKAKTEGEVYFIPTIHGGHKSNVKYNYDTLFTIIERLNPDVLAVEIRPEDVDADSSYLNQLYPYEMRFAKYRFPDVKVVGLDWLGDEFRGRLLTQEELDSEFEVHTLYKKMRQDTLYTERLKHCNHRHAERMNLVATASLEELLNSADAEIVKDYYDCYYTLLIGSPHEKSALLTKKRDEEILKNIKSIIEEHKGKRIVIIAGDDHFVMLKDEFPNKQPY